MTNNPQVCLAHHRWYPCLTSEHRYDSPNKTCRVTTDNGAVDTMRLFHGGQLSRAEMESDLQYIENDFDIPVESIPFIGVIS